MKQIYKNRKVNIFSIAITLFSVILIHSCNNKDELNSSDLLDSNIVNAPELEEYIITGSDLKQSLAIFTNKLSKIDFSKLIVTYDAEGKKIRYLPN